MRYALAIAAVLVACVVTGLTACGTETAKIGVVDVKRVYDESKYKGHYERLIQEFYAGKRREGEALRQTVAKRIEDIRLEAMMLTDEGKKGKQKEMLAEELKLKEFARNAQRAVEDKKRQYLGEFEETVTTIVKELAAEKGLDLVFNSAAVLYNKDAYDYTELVLKRINEAFAKQYGDAGSSDEGS